MRVSEELRLRTKNFASSSVRLFREMPAERDDVYILSKQLLRSGPSVAAHAREASRSRSDAELCSKLDCLLQEADESQLWLELLKEDCGIENDRIAPLHAEASEIIAIFSTIVFKVRSRIRNEKTF